MKTIALNDKWALTYCPKCRKVYYNLEYCDCDEEIPNEETEDN
jgi:hypothetical protein